MTDRAGRSGRAVALAYPGQRFTIAFDRDSYEILEWTLSPSWPLSPAAPGRLKLSGSPSRVETVLETGYASRVP